MFREFESLSDSHDARSSNANATYFHSNRINSKAQLKLTNFLFASSIVDAIYHCFHVIRARP